MRFALTYRKKIMLKINCYLDNGATITITGLQSGNLLAKATLTDGHEAEMSMLKAYLTECVHVSATVCIDGRSVGAWTV